MTGVNTQPTPLHNREIRLCYVTDVHVTKVAHSEQHFCCIENEHVWQLGPGVSQGGLRHVNLI